ncbi:MAG TPA: hypothetical protein VNY36_00490, partial [Bacteroidia bacterium]|nr:hypothetical protein [Bacteroidia bacterium]
GLAASYQDETIIWWLASTSPGSMPYDPPCSDKLSRTNAALRILAHLPLNTKFVEFYGGIRPGICYWQDNPSANNNPYHNTTQTTPFTFLGSTNETAFSLQFLFGMHVYVNKFIGLHFEAGIGSPYLAECGLSIRINTHKDITTQPQGK